MSAFSEYLQELIQNRGISISQLSRDSGVERTAIHKALTGERVLPYYAVESLAYHLKLSPKETQRFRRSYDQLFENENIRQIRKIIDRIFLKLPDLVTSKTDDREYARSEFSPQAPEEKSIYRGASNILRLLCFLTAEERKQDAPQLELLAPAEVRVVGEYIETVYESRLDIKISHIVCFDTVNKEGECDPQNLECFNGILPGCILSDGRYHVHYYYDKEVRKQYMDPFPYFLAASTGVVCLSENCQTAIYLRDEEQIKYFRGCFYHLRQSCHRLAEYVKEAVTDIVFDHAPEEECCAIMSQPYLEQTGGGKLTTLFTRKGISEFLETGRPHVFPGGTTGTSDGEEREKALGMFLEAIRENRVGGRIVNGVSFSIPDDLAILAFRYTGFFLCGKDGGWGVRIQERGLSQALYDWCVYLAGSDRVFDKDMTVEMIAEMLR